MCCRLGPAETRVESVVLRVRVVDRLPRLVDLGSTPLVVPGFYALSNAIDRSVVNIKGRDGAACTVRLLAAAGALTAGRLVREDDGLRRKGAELHPPRFPTRLRRVVYLFFLSPSHKNRGCTGPAPLTRSAPPIPDRFPAAQILGT